MSDGLLRATRQHVTDSVGLFVVSTPLGAVLENVLAGMSDEVSMKSRIIVGGLYLAGLGGALGYVRDRSRKLFNITDETKERYQQIHDMTYIAAATSVVNPLIYVGAGATDWKEVAAATLFATGVAFVSGGAMGYSVDAFRDMTGYEKSKRIPRWVSEAPSKAKKALAAGVLAASIGAAGAIYQATPDKTSPQPPVQTESLEDYVR